MTESPAHPPVDLKDLPLRRKALIGTVLSASVAIGVALSMLPGAVRHTAIDAFMATALVIGAARSVLGAHFAWKAGNRTIAVMLAVMALLLAALAFGI